MDNDPRYTALFEWITQHTIWHQEDIKDMIEYHEGKIDEIQLTLTIPELLAIWEHQDG